MLQGSGTYSVEAAISCCVAPADKLLIVANGAYGDCIAEIARYYVINQMLISLEETQPVTPELVEKALIEDQAITHVAVVHGETTTSILNPIAEIASVVKTE